MNCRLGNTTEARGSLQNTGAWSSLSETGDGILQASDKVVKPIRDLNKSVVDDLVSLRRSPLVSAGVKLWGFVYHVDSAEMELVAKDLGRE